MFAVIKTGGKQYKVAANDVLKIEKLEAEPGTIVTFDEVLMVGDDGGTTLGAPLVAGASVAAEFLSTEKQKTVIILKKHRRQHYDRRNGHRQRLSIVRINEILLNGATPSIAPRRPAAASMEDPVLTAEVTDTAPVATSGADHEAIDAAVAASNEAAVVAAATPKSRRKSAPPADAAEAEALRADKPSSSVPAADNE